MNHAMSSRKPVGRALAPLAALLGFGTLATAVLLAQPDNPQPPANGEKPAMQPRQGKAGVNRPGLIDREFPTDPAELRDFIQRRMEHMRAALNDLDKGVDSNEVSRRLFRDLRQSLNEARDRANGGGEDGMKQPGAGGPGGEGRAGGGNRPGPDGGMPMNPNRGGQPSMIGEQMVRLSDFEIKSAMDVIRAERADLAGRIDEVAQRPEARVYDMLGSRLKGLADLKRTDAESLNLRLDEIRGLMDIMAITGDYARQKRSGADDATLQPLRDRLRAATAEQFDLRLALQQRSIEKLMTHSEKLRSDLERLRGDRERIIEEKTQQILRLAERPVEKPRLKGPAKDQPPQPPK